MTKSRYGIITDFVDSPDDGGFYVEQTDLDESRRRVSLNIYDTKDRAVSAFERDAVKWEEWSA